MKRFVQTVIVLLALHIMFPLVSVQAQEVIVDGIKYVIFQGHAVLAECLKEDVGDLIIPETVSFDGIEYPVTSVGGQVEDDGPYHNNVDNPHPFRNCETITSVTFPKTMKEVGIYAFQGCKNLKRLELAEAVNLGPHAFSYCTSLRKLLIPKGCRMSESAFGYCTLDTVVYATGNSTTDNWNFIGSTIGTIVIPQTVERLPGDWLYETAKVGTIILFKKTPPVYNVHNYSTPLENAMKAELYVPYGTMETYRKHADWGLFEKIHELPDTIQFEEPGTISTSDSTMATVDSMQYVLFRGHAVLAKCLKEDVGDLVIPESVSIGGKSYPVTSVGGQIEYDSLYSLFDGHNTGNDPRPFERCETIISVKFPQSVNYIGQAAFIGCHNLKDVILPDTVELGKGCFEDCISLKEVFLPKGAIRCTDRIWRGSPFGYCDFETVEFETGRESIAEEAWFSGCNVGTIIIPSTIKNIDNNWLYNTWKLGNIIIYAETPPSYLISELYDARNDETKKWQWELLSAAMNANLFVPDDALEAYENHKDWGLYEKIYPLSNLPTSLTNLRTDSPSQQSHSQGFYDLTGRRLAAPPAKGVYIKDGKIQVTH